MAAFSGSAAALNGVVFSTSAVGYNTAYVGITTSPSNGAATLVTGIFEASIDSTDGTNGTWFQIPAENIDGSTTPNGATSSIYFVQSGSASPTAFYKVRAVGLYI